MLLRTLPALVLTASLAGGLAACGGGDDVTFEADTTSIEVRFSDSSVPPEYHRSWTLLADGEEATLEVDSYGDVVATAAEEMPDGVWPDLADAIEDVAATDDVGDSGDCTGGTTLETVVRTGDGEAVTTISSCGDGGTEEQERLLDLLAPLTALVDLEANTAVEG